MRLRRKLSYANVVGTLALVLLLATGSAFAAGKLGKNKVRSQNIAKGAVKMADLVAGSVNGAKIKDGTVSGADVANQTIGSSDLPSVIAAAVTAADITGRASIAGGQGLSNPSDIALPVTGQATFTPDAGSIAAIVGEARFSIASTVAGNQCSAQVSVLANGKFAFSMEVGFESTTLRTVDIGKGFAPFGLLNPGTPLRISAVLNGDTDCSADSSLGPVALRILQVR